MYIHTYIHTDKTRLDNHKRQTRQDIATKEDKTATRQDKTRHDMRRQDKARQDNHKTRQPQDKTTTRQEHTHDEEDMYTYQSPSMHDPWT